MSATTPKTASVQRVGATIWTGDPAQPWASSMLVGNGLVVALDHTPGINSTTRTRTSLSTTGGRS